MCKYFMFLCRIAKTTFICIIIVLFKIEFKHIKISQERCTLDTPWGVVNHPLYTAFMALMPVTRRRYMCDRKWDIASPIEGGFTHNHGVGFVLTLLYIE